MDDFFCSLVFESKQRNHNQNQGLSFVFYQNQPKAAGQTALLKCQVHQCTVVQLVGRENKRTNNETMLLALKKENCAL